MEWIARRPLSPHPEGRTATVPGRGLGDRDQKEIDGIDQIVNGLPKLLQLDPQTQFANRDRLYAASRSQGRGRGDAMTKMMVEIWKAATPHRRRQPRSPARPPTRRWRCCSSWRPRSPAPRVVAEPGPQGPLGHGPGQELDAAMDRRPQNISSMPMQWAGLPTPGPRCPSCNGPSSAQWGGTPRSSRFRLPYAGPTVAAAGVFHAAPRRRPRRQRRPLDPSSSSPTRPTFRRGGGDTDQLQSTAMFQASMAAPTHGQRLDLQHPALATSRRRRPRPPTPRTAYCTARPRPDHAPAVGVTAAPPLAVEHHEIKLTSTRVALALAVTIGPG